MALTEKEIKTIKYEKRIAYVFSGFILVSAALYNLYYFVTNKNIDIIWVILINFGLFVLSILIPELMNRKYNLDIKSGKKIVRTATIQQIETEISYEAGSGMLYIPILGNLFPKIWGQNMRPTEKLYFVINNFRYEVDKEKLSEAKIDDTIEMYYSEHSKTLLGIELKKD